MLAELPVANDPVYKVAAVGPVAVTKWVKTPVTGVCAIRGGGLQIRQAISHGRAGFGNWGFMGFGVISSPKYKLSHEVNSISAELTGA